MSTIKNLTSALLVPFLMLLSLFGSILFQSQAEAALKPLIFLPFAAGQTWYTVQAPGGSFSHTGNQYYSYDFTRVDGETYGSRVYSPGAGVVEEIRRGVPDWQYNSESSPNNNYGWGNTIVIKMNFNGSDIYVRMAHLQQGSMDHLVKGDHVDQGDVIGLVGQTGFSTNPHMHIQVQESVRGESVPFEFVEGVPGHGEQIKSRMERDLHVVDNKGRVNAGSFIDDLYTGTRGSWSYYSLRYPTVGTYAVTNSDAPLYRWRFELPKGGFTLYASYTNFSSRTWSAHYQVYGTVSRRLDEYVDQRNLYGGYGPSFAEKLHPLGTISTQMSNNQITVDVNNQGSGSLCADVIFIKQRW